MQKFISILVGCLVALFFCSCGGGGGSGSSSGNGSADTGSYSASGTYDYNAARDQLSVSVANSGFPADCGPEVGTFVNNAEMAETLSIIDSGGDDPTIFMRSSGTFGSIVGEWETTDTDSDGDMTVTFSGSGELSVTTTGMPCGATGDYTAEGTYTYDSTSKSLAMDFTTSGFPTDCGPGVGSITETAQIAEMMGIYDPADDDSVELYTRTSGAFGEITGSWALWDNGQLPGLSLAFNADGTFIVSAAGFDCNGGDDDGDDGDNGNDGTPDLAADPQFVAVGSQGTVVYSQNGSEWGYPNITQLQTTVDLSDVACDVNGNCVTVGADGFVAYSSDGISWNEATIPASVSQDLKGVSYGNGKWIAVGYENGVNAIIDSSDGGQTWNANADTLPTTDGLKCVAYGMVNGIGRWVTLGGHSGGVSVYSDDNGATWTDFDILAASGGAPLYDMVYANGTWAAVGWQGTVVYSDDGIIWNTGLASAAGIPVTENLWGLAVGQGYFVAVGQAVDGWGAAKPSIILRSGDDGQTYSEIPLNSVFTSLGRPVGDVAYGNGRWAAISLGGDHLLSTDGGESWNVQAMDKYGVYAICYRP